MSQEKGHWQKFWISQNCTTTFCLRHNITTKDVDDDHPEQGLGDGMCPECKALGLKGSEWIPD